MQIYDSRSTGFEKAITLGLELLGGIEYHKLALEARALLLDFAILAAGQPNGRVRLPAWQLEAKGWTRRKLARARQELIAAKFVLQTHQGGSRDPSLYWCAWLEPSLGSGIDETPRRRRVLVDPAGTARCRVRVMSQEVQG